MASWRITKVAAASELARHRFTRKQPLTREGYAALAEAEIALARQLAAAIAESLQDLSPRAPSKAGE